MIPAEKNPLTARETALRMLEHMHDDVSYGDIIRQLRILQDIDDTLNDVEMAGSPADQAVAEARVELEPPNAEDEVDENEVRYRPPSAVVLRSRSAGKWKSLAERPERRLESLLRSAAWLY